MSMIEEFENAPIGAIATLPGCPTVVKVTDLPADKGNWSDGVVAWKAEYLVACGYQLDKLPGAPKTAREALDLAWELAHPVKEGQVIPEGVRLLDRSVSNDLSAYATLVNITINARETLSVRTLEPFPDPEPDWLNAPAVLADCAVCADCEVEVDDGLQITIHGPIFDGQKWECTECQTTLPWRDLIDVTPLYPKGTL